MILRKIRGFVLFLFAISSMNLHSQSIHVAGMFPTIDHSGTLSNKLDYSLYYFAAFPLVNFARPDISNDSYFHLLYLEQALTFKVDSKFSLTGSYVYQRANVVYDNYVNENRFYFQGKYKHAIKKNKFNASPSFRRKVHSKSHNK
jgi:hypothetical protein